MIVNKIINKYLEFKNSLEGLKYNLLIKNKKIIHIIFKEITNKNFITKTQLTLFCKENNFLINEIYLDYLFLVYGSIDNNIYFEKFIKIFIPINKNLKINKIEKEKEDGFDNFETRLLLKIWKNEMNNFLNWQEYKKNEINSNYKSFNNEICILFNNISDKGILNLKNINNNLRKCNNEFLLSIIDYNMILNEFNWNGNNYIELEEWKLLIHKYNDYKLLVNNNFIENFSNFNIKKDYNLNYDYNDYNDSFYQILNSYKTNNNININKEIILKNLNNLQINNEDIILNNQNVFNLNLEKEKKENNLNNIKKEIIKERKNYNFNNKFVSINNNINESSYSNYEDKDMILKLNESVVKKINEYKF